MRMSTYLTDPPEIVHREAQPYVAVQRAVTMDTFEKVADRVPELIGWLLQRGIEPAGAPFLRYLVIDMERELLVEAGVPVPGDVPGDVDDGGEVAAKVLPEGRYVVVTHLGHPDDLVAVTAEVLAWASEQGLEWDVDPGDAGERWGCRLEVFLTDPREQPDMRLWRTELAFRLRD